MILTLFTTHTKVKYVVNDAIADTTPGRKRYFFETPELHKNAPFTTGFRHQIEEHLLVTFAQRVIEIMKTSIESGFNILKADIYDSFSFIGSDQREVERSVIRLVDLLEKRNRQVRKYTGFWCQSDGLFLSV